MNRSQVNKRLFIAVPLKGLLTKRIEQIQTEWQKELNLPASSRISQEKFHLTLHFLGSIPQNKIEDICQVLRPHQRHSSFLFSLSQCLAFPSLNRARVITLAGSSGNSPLSYLFHQIGKSLEEVGMKLEMRTFIPHVTLFRIQEGSIGSVPSLGEPVGIPVTEFSIYETVPGGKGSTYSILKSWQLKGDDL